MKQGADDGAQTEREKNKKPRDSRNAGGRPVSAYWDCFHFWTPKPVTLPDELVLLLIAASRFTERFRNGISGA